MSYSFPIWTIILSVFAIGLALLGIWACKEVRDDEKRVAFTLGAVCFVVAAGIGWNSNFNELCGQLDTLDRVRADQKAKDDKHRAEIVVLTQYKSAYEAVVQSALTTAPTRDGDRTVFQTVMLHIPADFSHDVIQQTCKDRVMVRDALAPLVAQGTIKAGERPAWNALLNCAALTPTTSAR